MKNSIRSNFDMLHAYEGQLWRLGALAERYFAEDPNTSLLKLRRLSELLAQSLATQHDKFEDVFGTDPCGGLAALAKRADSGEAGRWRKHTREQIRARGDNLDISRLKDDSLETLEAQRDELAMVARMVMRELTGAMADLRSLLEELGEDPDAALGDLLVDADESALVAASGDALKAPA